MSKRSYERRIRAKREAERAARKRAEKLRKLRIAGTIVAALAVATVLLVVFLGGSKTKPTASPTPTPTPSASPVAGCTYPAAAPRPNGKTFTKAPPLTIDRTKVYIATFTTSCGKITVRMDASKAPASVNNFVFLARQGYFDNTRIPRVQNESSFGIVQAGTQNGTISGGVGYSYAGEKPAAGTRYARGTVAMANSGAPSSNGSQFFFVTSTNTPGLDQNPVYSIFGKADDATSLATLDRIVSAGGTPIPNLGVTPEPPLYILKVTIEELKRG
jgi:peptidyl-prolyl cis-trans isomerase B (cyclophilin B)